MATTLSYTIQEDQNLETCSLVWLDTSVNKSEENIQAQKQLQTIINHFLTFEDEQECFQHIQLMSDDDRIILIVSGKLGQIIVPKILKYRQIVSIYVYCMNKEANEQWAKQFNKIKGVIVDFNELIYRIKTDQHERKHNKINESLLFYIINSNDTDQGQSMSEISGDFLHSQLLIDCLIKMKSNTNDKNELISLCQRQYERNIDELKIIKEFKREYSSDRALWWYTRDSFVYRILNKALRIQNIDLLYLFRFFIHDIEEQLKENQCLNPIHVYRAQLMSKKQVQILKDSLGEFIAFNSFLSTSFDCEEARSFFLSKEYLNNIEQVYFEIYANPQLDNIKPFGDISLYSYYPKEKEVLFMIGSIFQIVNIDRDQEGILIVRMKLCSLNDDHHMKALFQNLQEKYISEETNLVDFSNILTHMNQWDAAEKYYYRFLNEFPDNDGHIATCYQGLGIIAMKKENYESSLRWHSKALKMKMQRLTSNNFSIASSYISIGNVYHKQNDYTRALKSYEKALKIYKEVFGENDINVGVCMNCMGNSYRRKHEYSKALELYHKALSVQEKHLPTDHPDLGVAHNNIGNTHADLGHYDLALSHYNLALKIYKKSFPSQHPSIASTLRNIGLMYEEKDDFQQALSYYEKAAVIFRHLLPSTHPDVIHIEEDICRIPSELILCYF